MASVHDFGSIKSKAKIHAAEVAMYKGLYQGTSLLVPKSFYLIGLSAPADDAFCESFGDWT
jgi:hypothetical protein